MLILPSLLRIEVQPSQLSFSSLWHCSSNSVQHCRNSTTFAKTRKLCSSTQPTVVRWCFMYVYVNMFFSYASYLPITEITKLFKMNEENATDVASHAQTSIENRHANWFSPFLASSAANQEWNTPFPRKFIKPKIKSFCVAAVLFWVY
jgi:hypothetical protein